ncbi:MAG: CoB--CoM heterodisulfide reductase iron-sulfur subunit A family protein [Bacteroidetes bacterium]|uniref:CoB--CoM heterodisulfide reductase iron-sulfur subunit A family protein n=1 Tax=Candidatus Cryptobacteroides merdigallinarum TaxID=2840770 RepID=A0A9D9EK78_9BACT|nr:CoB--CoM heterodisulfide reductase iron-sulfur subunit A family protein [Candidatus Cryptobacteroides merdigallinarum]
MKENIVIIGGGIAGLEAAGQLSALGYKPIIIEKEDHLGGHVADWHRLFPDMTPARDVVNGLIARAADANIFLNTGISFVNKLKDSYNIMLSNGISIITRIILVTTGFSVFDASRKEEYGYGVYDQVMTNRDLEHWFNTGDDKRVNNCAMNAVGFVHCVGSRDEKARNPQCSKVCCITAIKQAIEIKQKFPEAMVYCFYMDLRMFGKKYEDFYINAQRDYGIRFIRGRVSEVSENIDGRVIVKAEDTLSGKPIKVTLDLLVLMAGMVCSPDSTKVANMANLPVDSDGFLKSRDNITDIIESPKEGVFYAGACTGPKTVPETLAEARAAALEVHLYIKGLE